MNIDKIYKNRLSEQTATYLAIILFIVASVTFLDIKASCSPAGVVHAVQVSKIELVETCAKDDMVEAVVALGRLYADGRLVQQDKHKAFGLCQKAALEGNADGMYCLGNFYANAVGTIVNDKQAFYWFEQAANHQHEAATLRLANCYLAGIGVTQDSPKAKKLFENLAEKGNAEAIKALAKQSD